MKTLVGGLAIFVVLYVTAIVVTKDIFGQEGVHFGVFVFLSGICMLSVNLWVQRWFSRIANEKQPTPEERKEAVEKMLDEAGYPRDAPVTKGSGQAAPTGDKGRPSGKKKNSKVAGGKAAVQKGFLSKKEPAAGTRAANKHNKWGVVDTGPATTSAPQKLPNAELPKDDDGVEEFVTSGARKAMEQEAKQSQKMRSKPANTKKSAAKPKPAASVGNTSGVAKKAAKNLDDWDLIDWDEEITKVNGDSRACGEKSKDEKRRAEMIEMIHRDPVGMKKINDQMGLLKGKPKHKSAGETEDRKEHVDHLKKMMADKGVDASVFSPEEWSKKVGAK